MRRDPTSGEAIILQVRYTAAVAVVLVLLGLASIFVGTTIPPYSCESPLVLQSVQNQGPEPRCVVVQAQGTPGSVPPESDLPLKIALALSGTTSVAVGAFLGGRLRMAIPTPPPP